ncbi:phage baseplate assembly protein V [Alicyclobacillus tolerans]|uniref:phage baseplate assembly protein V n=1 Tax=Alicyclobacillus tolerans TaxID=90970 RepID=UPI001F34E164|nr:phage baseplate assembly protein V [Alicyclobacillus tolerans]MCF8566918.1 phage baseplate assembly protein V [Alicyclobacillus tolerans]
MTISSNDWYEQIKDYIHRAVGQNLSVIEGTVSSRQTSPPSVKVTLQPYGIETGWIRVGTPYAGNGFGFLAIPPEGQAVKVIFDMGDKQSATVVCDVYNDVDVPPTLANVDDVMLIHTSGSQLVFHQSGDVLLKAVGNLTLTGKTTTQTL